MGVVFKARDTKLERFVTLKFLSAHQEYDPEEKERFIHEAKAASAIEHPNVCSVFEINQTEDGQLFIAMSYCDGESLKEKIKEGPLSIEQVLEISLQIARGLSRAHEKGIVHRDIKPANIMMTRQDEVKIVDFGLAKLAGKSQFTQTGTTVGTAAYMAPEQMQGLEVDHRCDIFSLGVVMYEMLAGCKAFTGDYQQALMYAILNETPTPIRTLRPEVPEVLEQVVNRAMEKDREKRYQKTDELVQDLILIKKSMEQGSHSMNISSLSELSGGFSEKTAQPPRRRFQVRPVVLMGAGATLLFGLLLLFLIFPGMRNLFHTVPGFLGLPQEKYIAVLPFTNIGDDPSNQSFCDGLGEILTSQLSQLERFQGKLWVVPAGEIRKSSVVTAQEAQAEFGVNLAIGGSIQRFADGVRLTINLIDPESKRQLNSQIIDDPLKNVPLLQDQVMVKVAEMLNIQLNPQSKKVLVAGKTRNSRAFELYLKARGHLLRYDNPENVDSAITLFEKAVNQDPTYALAHAGLGEAYLLKYKETKEIHWVDLAKRFCYRAEELDGSLAPVRVNLGLIHTETGDYEAALRDYQKAMELDPANADAYRGRAKAYMALGMLEEAEATYRKAIEMKPDFWSGYNELGRFYFQQGRYEEAVNQFQRVVELTPRNVKGYINLGSAYFYLNRRIEAIQAFTKAQEIKPRYSIYSNLATLYYYEGKYREAARMYEKALDLQDGDYKVWDYLAVAYERTKDEKDKAVMATKQAIRLAEDQLTINPRNPELLTNLAGYYERLSENEKALNFLRQAADQNPSEVLILYDMGHIYEQLGERDQALKWIEEALKKGYSLEDLRNDPGLWNLIKDARFQQIAHNLDSGP
ncbi:MAG: hypothetical protein Kow0042_08000 [Calditrichia bacterium]